jgi:hypothetical protein
MAEDESTNDCAVFAALAHRRIREGGLDSRLLVLTERGEDKAHVVVCFPAPDNAGLYVFDGAGSRLVPGATLQWDARSIARAAGFDATLVRWQGTARPSGNRRLSPRECRGRGLFPL